MKPKRTKITWNNQKVTLALLDCTRYTLWKALIFLNDEKDVSPNGRAPGRELARKILLYAEDKLTPKGQRRAQMVAEGRVKELT